MQIAGNDCDGTGLDCVADPTSQYEIQDPETGAVTIYVIGRTTCGPPATGLQPNSGVVDISGAVAGLPCSDVVCPGSTVQVLSTGAGPLPTMACVSTGTPSACVSDYWVCVSV